MQKTDVKIKLENSTMVAYLSGEIDHHCAANLRSFLDVKIQTSHPKLLILDFANISFMDSSGIGLVMGRYKLMKCIGGTLKIKNPSNQIRKVMTLAGFDRLSIVEKMKPIKPMKPIKRIRSEYIGKK